MVDNEKVEETMLEFEDRLEKTSCVVAQALSVIGAGRANPHVLDRVEVEAFPVSHGTLEAYGYRFTTIDGKVIVVSGDAAPLEIVAQKARGADILLHEVEYAAGIASREPKWQRYHREVHTLSTDLAEVARQAQPKLLVTYHRIYHMNIQDNRQNLPAELQRRCGAILREIRDAGYSGAVVNGEDLDIFDI